MDFNDFEWLWIDVNECEWLWLNFASCWIAFCLISNGFEIDLSCLVLDWELSLSGFSIDLEWALHNFSWIFMTCNWFRMERDLNLHASQLVLSCAWLDFAWSLNCSCLDFLWIEMTLNDVQCILVNSNEFVRIWRALNAFVWMCDGPGLWQILKEPWLYCNGAERTLMDCEWIYMNLNGCDWIWKKLHVSPWI